MNNKNISIIGIPFDENSSYKKGPAQAPKLIKESLVSTNILAFRIFTIYKMTRK